MIVDDYFSFSFFRSADGLAFRGTLESGTTKSCDTFANPPLAAGDEFRVRDFEVFALVHEE